MKIFFIQRKNEIAVDNNQITTILNDKISPQVSNVEIVSNNYNSTNEWQKIPVTKNDIVILGLGHRFNPEYVREEIAEQIKFFVNKNIKVAVATEYRYFDENEKYYDKDTDNLLIHKLSQNYRLPVLDIYSFINAWYLSTTVEEKETALEQVPGLENKQQFKPAQGKQIFTSFIANWLYRRFFMPAKQDYFYGASMYPEVWSDEVVQKDIDNLHQTGFNTVRIGEFFWDKLEPEEGHYDMDYLKDLLGKYQKDNINVILGIPSPTPPRWFTVRYPTARIVNKDGQVDEHGSRQHVCTNNLIFRKKVYELTRQIAYVAKDYPNVKAIQMDNEFKCHIDQCFCSTCQSLWHRWLKEKYLTINHLNQAWGTDIWSERYPDFASVVMPVKTPFTHNAGLENAFAKFTQDTLNDFASGIAQILIAKTDITLLHNTSMNFNLDNFELFNQLDFVGYDTYPRFNEYWNFPINLDLWRNLKDNQKFYLLETCASHVGYIGNYVPPYPPDYLVTEIFLGYAAGLSSILFWPYRAQPSGVEQTHGAVITQAGTPDLGYQDVVKGGKLLQRIKPILEKTTIRKSKVAIIYSDAAKLYMNTESGGIYRYRPTFTEFYEAITRRGISVEIINENDDFSKFNCIFAPFIRFVSDSLLDKFKRFANSGGKLYLGPLTGDRTIDGNWHADKNGLGKLGEWLQVKDVVQYLSSEEKTSARIHIKERSDQFKDLVTLFNTDYTIKDFVTEALVAGERSITYQKGNVTYLGGMPQDCMKSAFWDELLEPVKKQSKIMMDDGIYKYERENDQEIYIFLANMSDHEANYGLKMDCEDTDGAIIVKAGQHRMSAFSYQILKLKK